MSSTETRPETRLGTRTGPRRRTAALLRPQVDDAPVVEKAPGLTLRQIVRRFWPDLRPYRAWLVVGLVLMAVVPAIEVVEILLFQRLVDDVLVPASFDALPWLVVAYVVLNLLSALVSGADDYVGTWVTQTFLVRLRGRAFDHALSLPLPVLARRRLGDVLQRLTSDVAAVERFMVAQLGDLVSSTLRLLFFAGALFWLQWELALASLVVVPLFWGVSAWFAGYVRDLSRERRRRGGALGSVSEETLGSAALVQTVGAEAQAHDRYQRQSLAIKEAELASSRVRSVFTPVVDLVELLGVLLVVTLGVWALSTERLTLGGLLAFMTLLVQCYRPARALGDLLPELFSASAGIERVVELLDEEPPRDRPGATPLPRDPRGAAGAISMRGVTAAYPGGERAVLHDLHLDVEAGERVAVVGPSGVGKSTLAWLLTRQLDPVAGQVLLGGHDLADHTRASVRDHVSVVLQEPLLLDSSVRDNLLLARPDAADADLWEALDAAGATDFVSDLDARVGQRGRLLSGGQRQRLCVARALLRDTPVLVLDEPTTGLDDAAAERLLAPLATGHRRTVLVLTHDPRALAHVDRVVDLGVLQGVPA